MANTKSAKMTYNFDDPSYYGLEVDEYEECLVPAEHVPEGVPGKFRQGVFKLMTGNFALPSPDTIQKINPEMAFFGQSFPSDTKYIIQSNDQSQLLNIRSMLQSCGDKPKVYLLTHGFVSKMTAGWMNEMKDKILSAEESAVVILIGWGGGCAKLWEYMNAIANLSVVGKEVGNVLVSLGMRKPTIIGIGHSLGAHLMASISRNCKATGDLVFSRICGLDPAGFGFEKSNHRGLMLDSSDARLVDVIHTDGCVTRRCDTDHFNKLLASVPEDWCNPAGYFGTMLPLGHLDFYPNGGHDQPGTKGASKFPFKKSHSFAHQYFIHSFDHPERFQTNIKLLKTSCLRVRRELSSRPEVCPTFLSL